MSEAPGSLTKEDFEKTIETMKLATSGDVLVLRVDASLSSTRFNRIRETLHRYVSAQGIKVPILVVPREFDVFVVKGESE